ncbi:MAG: MFS transporter, partial [Deinococcales bacterium]
AVERRATTAFATVRRFSGVLSTAGLAQWMAQTLRAGRKVLLPLYASQVLGLDVGTVGFILSASAFADMTLFYPAGWLMDRRGRKFAIVPSFLLQAVGLALVPLTQGFATLLAVAVLLGFGNGLSAGTMMTLGADLAPREALGEFLGVWRLVGDAGSSGGPLLVGAVADVLDLGLAAVAVAVVGLGAALVFAYRVPETLRRA